MCRSDALTTCANHRPVPCRRLEFEMIEDCRDWMHGHLVYRRDPIGHTDGLGCPACGSFEPIEKPSGRAR